MERLDVAAPPHVFPQEVPVVEPFGQIIAVEDPSLGRHAGGVTTSLLHQFGVDHQSPDSVCSALGVDQLDEALFVRPGIGGGRKCLDSDECDDRNRDHQHSRSPASTPTHDTVHRLRTPTPEAPVRTDSVIRSEDVVSLLLLLISFSTQATSSEFVLVRDELAPAHADGETVLGWRRVPATAVDGSQRAVPDVRLELLEGSNPEPFGGDQWGLQMVGAPDIWHESTGSGVVIAIVDSGVDLDHPDLADRIFTNRGEIAGNGVDDDGNGLIDDVHGWDLIDGDNDPTDPSQGHGTEVAGVAAASLNGVGIAGVAPSATILPIRACTSSCSLFNVAWAITYATDVGADVI